MNDIARCSPPPRADIDARHVRPAGTGRRPRRGIGARLRGHGRAYGRTARLVGKQGDAGLGPGPALRPCDDTSGNRDRPPGAPLSAPHRRRAAAVNCQFEHVYFR